MKPLSSGQRRGLILFAYLMPPIAFVLQLIWALIPHVYVIYDGAASEETWNLFGLMGRMFSVYSNQLSEAKIGQDMMMFCYFVIISVILCLLCFALWGGFALLEGAMSLRAFSHAPTSRESNRSKRWLHLLCPNRVLYALFCLCSMVPTLFPPLLSYFYEKFLWRTVRVESFFLADWILALILITLCLAAFFATLKLQNEERMDMFRLYRKKD